MENLFRFLACFVHGVGVGVHMGMSVLKLEELVECCAVNWRNVGEEQAS